MTKDILRDVEIFIKCRTCDGVGLVSGQDCLACGSTGYELSHVNLVDVLRCVADNIEALRDANSRLVALLESHGLKADFLEQDDGEK